MKKNVLIKIFAVLFLTVVMFSCEKENEVITSETKSIEVSDTQIYAKNGMLVFASMESFNSTLKQLEDDNLKHQQSLSVVISKMKNEFEINSYIEKANWNYDLTFETFEKRFDYVSLRSVIAEKMIDYNKIFDATGIENPDDHFVGDYYWRTLLNENCEVMIGTSIYKMLAKDLTIEIKNLNFDIAEKINIENFLNFDLNEEIFIYGEMQIGKAWQVCQSNFITNWFQKTYTHDNKQRKLSAKIDVNNYFTGVHNIQGSSKTEYWNGTSWKNWSTNHTHYYWGQYYNGSTCSGDITQLLWPDGSKIIVDYDGEVSPSGHLDMPTFSIKTGYIGITFSAPGNYVMINPTW
jgi:hypothetical protein